MPAWKRNWSGPQVCQINTNLAPPPLQSWASAELSEACSTVAALNQVRAQPQRLDPETDDVAQYYSQRRLLFTVRYPSSSHFRSQGNEYTPAPKHSLSLEIEALVPRRLCMWIQSAFVVSPCYCLIYLMPFLSCTLFRSSSLPRDPPRLFNSLCVYIPESALSANIRMLVFILCQFCLSQSIDKLYTTPFVLVTSLLSPFWFIRFSDLWFWLSLWFLPAPWYLCFLDFWFLTQARFLIILLPVDLYYASPIAWLRILPEINNILYDYPDLHRAPYSDVTVHSDHHRTSRPSPASTKTGSARRYPGVPATTAAGSHVTRADYDAPDSGPLYLGLGFATRLRFLGTICPLCTICSTGTGTGVPTTTSHLQHPRAMPTPAWEVRRWAWKLPEFSDAVSAPFQSATKLLPHRVFQGRLHCNPAHRKS